MSTSASVPSRKRGKTSSNAILQSILALLGGAILVSFLGCAAITGDKHAAERKTIEALSKLQYPDQLEQAKPLCTKKGFPLLKEFHWFADYNVVSFKSNPTFCDVELLQDSAEGKTRYHVHLVKDNGWKFDDIYFNEIKGKPCNRWFSYMVEHPIESVLSFYSDDLFESAKETLDFGTSLFQLINELRKAEEMDKKRSEFQ